MNRPKPSQAATPAPTPPTPRPRPAISFGRMLILAQRRFARRGGMPEPVAA